MRAACAQLGGHLQTQALGRSQGLWLLYYYAPPSDANLPTLLATIAGNLFELGEVTALVAGANCDGAASAAAQIAGVAKVLKALVD